jgi:hypothetical protein
VIDNILKKKYEMATIKNTPRALIALMFGAAIVMATTTIMTITIIQQAYSQPLVTIGAQRCLL